MTPFKKAGYTENTKFKVLIDYDDLVKGDIVTLLKDDGSTNPYLITEDGIVVALYLPGILDKRPELEVYKGD